MAQRNSEIIDQLLSYKKTLEQNDNYILQDKTVISYCASLLEHENLKIVNLCLDILEDLMRNKQMDSALLKSFEIFKPLENLLIRSRSIDKKIADRVTKMIKILKDFVPPAYGTRLRKRKYAVNLTKASLIYHLCIPDLNEENRKMLEEVLVSNKDMMISYQLDVPHQSCTLSLGPRQKLDTVMEKITEIANMSAMLAWQDVTTGYENLSDLIDRNNKRFIIADNKEDKNAMNYFTNISRSVGGIFRSVTDFWNR